MISPDQHPPNTEQDLARVELAIKRKELEQLERNLKGPRWLSVAAIPVATVLISVGGSLVIAHNAAKQRDIAFTADVIQSVVEQDQVEGYRKLELLLSAGLVSDRNGQVDRAVAAMRPRVASELAVQGRELISVTGNDSLPRAIQLFRTAVEINPEDPENHYLLGQALLNLGRVRNHIPYLEEAVDELEIAYAADRSDTQYALWLGRAYMDTRQHDLARPLFQSIVDNPDNRVRQAFGLAAQHLREIEARSP